MSFSVHMSVSLNSICFETIEKQCKHTNLACHKSLWSHTQNKASINHICPGMFVNVKSASDVSVFNHGLWCIVHTLYYSIKHHLPIMKRKSISCLVDQYAQCFYNPLPNPRTTNSWMSSTVWFLYLYSALGSHQSSFTWNLRQVCLYSLHLTSTKIQPIIYSVRTFWESDAGSLILNVTRDFCVTILEVLFYMSKNNNMSIVEGNITCSNYI